MPRRYNCVVSDLSACGTVSRGLGSMRGNRSMTRTAACPSLSSLFPSSLQLSLSDHSSLKRARRELCHAVSLVMSAIVEALKPKKAKKKVGAGTSEGVKPPSNKEPAPETPVTPATGAATPQVVEEEGVGKSKGPVEEVIAKRARQLAKKLVSDPSWSGGAKLSDRGSDDDADGVDNVDLLSAVATLQGLCGSIPRNSQCRSEVSDRYASRARERIQRAAGPDQARGTG
jgi:hypothetical protein